MQLIATLTDFEVFHPSPVRQMALKLISKHHGKIALLLASLHWVWSNFLEEIPAKHPDHVCPIFIQGMQQSPMGIFGKGHSEVSNFEEIPDLLSKEVHGFDYYLRLD